MPHTNEEMEEWRKIKGYKDYEVSNLGRVRSFKKGVRVLKPGSLRRGYKSVTLSREGVGKSFRVHRLVGMAFLPLIKGKTQINHKDGKPWNNELNNLEWCNASENVLHSFRVLGKYVTNRAKLLNQYTLDGKLVRQWKSMAHAEREGGFSFKNISDVCRKRGTRVSHKGFKWQFALDEILSLKSLE